MEFTNSPRNKKKSEEILCEHCKSKKETNVVVVVFVVCCVTEKCYHKIG